MKTNLNFSLLTMVFIVLLLSCKNNQPTKTFKGYSVDFNSLKVLNHDSSLVSEAQYIFLETNNECLIGSCNKILVKNNCIYIMDRVTTNSVYVFNMKGDYLFKIDKQGKGPGEYIQMFDFDVDEFGHIYVFDNMKKNIIKYWSEGNNYENIKLSSYFEEFTFLNSNMILIRNKYNNGKVESNLSRMSLSNSKESVLLKGRPTFDDFRIIRMNNHYLYKSGKTILFNQRFSNLIYEVSEKDTICRIKFNPSSFPPENVVKDYIKDPMSILRPDKYIKEINNIYQNKEYYLMNINGFINNLLVIKKKDQKIKFIYDITNNYYLGDNNISATYNDFFVSKIEYNKNLSAKAIKSNLPEGVKAKFIEMNENSNPVISLFKVKI